MGWPTNDDQDEDIGRVGPCKWYSLTPLAWLQNISMVLGLGNGLSSLHGRDHRCLTIVGPGSTTQKQPIFTTLRVPNY